MTLDELAHRMGRSPGYVLGILHGLAADGLVEEHDGLWRLTPDTMRRHGRALAGWHPAD